MALLRARNCALAVLILSNAIVPSARAASIASSSQGKFRNLQYEFYKVKRQPFNATGSIGETNLPEKNYLLELYLTFGEMVFKKFLKKFPLKNLCPAENSGFSCIFSIRKFYLSKIRLEYPIIHYSA